MGHVAHNKPINLQTTPSVKSVSTQQFLNGISASHQLQHMH